MSDKEITAFDCVNGFTYIGRELAGRGLEDWVIIETKHLVPQSSPDTYKSLAEKMYQEMPKNKGSADFLREEQIVLRHKILESSKNTS